ncbi:hypothetical protein ACEN2P_03275 [Pedobacter psychrotolerans]|uniref:hypothetical protein n=1 Tax=Pedobacter psychrotolerans TaxID=1843235 RepID=UPI003F943254
MKSLLIAITLLICTVHYSFYQKKVTKFCEVTTRIGGLSGNKLKIEFIYGKSDSLTSIKGSKFEEMLKKLTAMSAVPDVLDYIYSLGWSLVGETAVGPISHFYFKKEFDESELLSH